MPDAPHIIYFGNEKIEDSEQRFVACYNACRGLNPEHVPELVGMVERLMEGLGEDTWWSLYRDAEELLAKVKA